MVSGLEKSWHNKGSGTDGGDVKFSPPQLKIIGDNFKAKGVAKELFAFILQGLQEDDSVRKHGLDLSETQISLTVKQIVDWDGKSASNINQFFFGMDMPKTVIDVVKRQTLRVSGSETRPDCLKGFDLIIGVKQLTPVPVQTAENDGI